MRICDDKGIYEHHRHCVPLAANGVKRRRLGSQINFVWPRRLQSEQRLDDQGNGHRDEGQDEDGQHEIPQPAAFGVQFGDLVERFGVAAGASPFAIYYIKVL